MSKDYSLEKRNIETRDDFLAYLHHLTVLIRDKKQVFENTDLLSFLDALGAWIHDMDGAYLNRGEVVPVQLSWQVMADMVAAALIYE